MRCCRAGHCSFADTAGASIARHCLPGPIVLAVRLPKGFNAHQTSCNHRTRTCKTGSGKAQLCAVTTWYAGLRCADRSLNAALVQSKTPAATSPQLADGSCCCYCLASASAASHGAPSPTAAGAATCGALLLARPRPLATGRPEARPGPARRPTKSAQSSDRDASIDFMQMGVHEAKPRACSQAGATVAAHRLWPCY